MSVQVVKDKQIKRMIVSATLESVKKVIKEFQKNDVESRTTGGNNMATQTARRGKEIVRHSGDLKGGARNFVLQRR